MRAACVKAIEAVHDEPGCELYALHQTGDTFVFIEQWQTQRRCRRTAPRRRSGRCSPRSATISPVRRILKMLEPIPAGDPAKASCASDVESAWGSLSGKVAFITGAARGQGRAHAVVGRRGGGTSSRSICAEQIAGVPYPLATPDDLAHTVKLVEDTGSASSPPGRRPGSGCAETALVEGIADLGRKLDIVIANAGIAPMMGESSAGRHRRQSHRV